MASIVNHQVAFCIGEVLGAWAFELLKRPDNEYIRNLPIWYRRVSRENGEYSGEFVVKSRFSNFGLAGYDNDKTTRVMDFHQFGDNSTTPDMPFLVDDTVIITLDELAETRYVPGELATAILGNSHPVGHRPDMSVIEALLNWVDSTNSAWYTFQDELSATFAGAFGNLSEAAKGILGANNIKHLRTVEFGKGRIAIHTVFGSNSLLLTPQLITYWDRPDAIEYRTGKFVCGTMLLGSDGNVFNGQREPRGVVWGAETASAISTIAGSGQSETVVETVRAVMEGMR